MNRITWAFYFLVTSVLWGNEPIRVDSPRDYAILDEFFRTTVVSEEYGYVLEGSKPISIRQIDALDNFLITKDTEYTNKEFRYALLFREAIPVWNRLCLEQSNFVLKSVSLNGEDASDSDLEILFINVPKLKEVIDQNITLFRYVLGPVTSSQQIVDKIVRSEQPLVEILEHDLTLTGIVLGFGAHNSLMGGRLETILSLSISKDSAPFAPQSIIMQREGNHSLNFLTAERYGTYYLELAGGDDTLFRKCLPLLRPRSGFESIEKELLALDALYEPLPASLWKNPKFVFGAYKGGSPNQPLFEQLQRSQKKIKHLLKSPVFVERVLEKISGKKPILLLDKSVLTTSTRSSILNSETWANILRKTADRFDSKQRKLAFINGFCHPTESSRQPPVMIGVSVAAFEGLKKALLNLKAANVYFETLSLDSALKMIVSKQLYFKTTQAGAGNALKEEDLVRMGFVIEDIDGNILFANHDTWLHLSQTIPGFAHGVQGMRIGEKRTLFVHPAFAYGALTTLPPCIGLQIKVHLQDIDPKVRGVLPDLVPLDLSWVQDATFYRSIETSIEQQPSFIGSFYRDLLDKMQMPDQSALITKLENIGSDIK
jgi:hypothetical protein